MAALIFAIGVALAVLDAVLVYLWFVGQAQVTGLVPSSLALWTMGYLISFILNLIFWELLLVGIPVVLAAIGAFVWWRRLPEDERWEYRRGRLFGRSRRSDWNNGFQFFVFIAFIVKIYLDGNWNTPFATWTLDYLVYSLVLAFIVILIIIGVPGLIGGTWWLSRELRKEQ